MIPDSKTSLKMLKRLFESNFPLDLLKIQLKGPLKMLKCQIKVHKKCSESIFR
jgi:hypothetical protein